MAVASPSWLAAVLGAAYAQPFSGGTCSSAACPYVGWSMPAPDMGKWGGLLSIFGGGE
jgi:hypothetical protein